MRAPPLASLLLTAAGGLAGHLGWGQHMGVAPLVPLPPSAGCLTSPKELGALVETQSPRPVQPTVFQERLTAQHSRPEPVYLLNARFIINELGSIKPQSIAEVLVYKGAEAPAHWRSLTETGIIDITLKPGVKLKLKSKSLAAIRRQVKASGVVRFQLNGLRLDDPSLRVAAAIAGLDVLRSETETIINIRLAPPRLAPPRHHPPGTIYIRGVATR